MFFLGDLTSLAQYAVDGIINGASYGIFGLSFGLIVAVTGRFHFAWSIGYALAGYFAAWIANHHGFAPVPAVCFGLFVAAVFGALSELLVYRPIAQRVPGDNTLAIFVASFGIAIAGVSIIRLAIPQEGGLGSETLNWIEVSPTEVGGVTFTNFDVISVAVLWGLAVATAALLRYSSLGRRIRAVRVNPTMAQAVGIDSGRIYVLVLVLGSLLAGVAAILFSMENAATPDMGTAAVFYAFVVAFAAGLGRSPLWVMTVGTLLGVAEGISGEFVSVQWQQVVVFAILLAFVIVKALLAWRPGLARPFALGSR